MHLFICHLINTCCIATGLIQSPKSVTLAHHSHPAQDPHPWREHSAGEIQWTKPAGIWHSLTFTLPFLHSLYIHLLVSTMMALHKSLDFFKQWLTGQHITFYKAQGAKYMIFHLLDIACWFHQSCAVKCYMQECSC